MIQKRVGPGAPASASRAGMTFAGEPTVNRTHSTFDGELHHALRLSRLRKRHGLTGPLAARIAALAFDGGVAR